MYMYSHVCWSHHVTNSTDGRPLVSLGILKCPTWTQKRNQPCPLATIYVDGSRNKSGIFRQTAKFGQPPCLFHSSINVIKNKLTKQTVKFLMRRLIRSRLIWFPLFANVCPNLPDVRIYPTLPYMSYVCSAAVRSKAVVLLLLLILCCLVFPMFAVVVLSTCF